MTQKINAFILNYIFTYFCTIKKVFLWGSSVKIIQGGGNIQVYEAQSSLINFKTDDGCPDIDHLPNKINQQYVCAYYWTKPGGEYAVNSCNGKCK